MSTPQPISSPNNTSEVDASRRKMGHGTGLVNDVSLLRTNLTQQILAAIHADKLSQFRDGEVSQVVQIYNQVVRDFQGLRADTQSFFEALSRRHCRVQNEALHRENLVKSPLEIAIDQEDWNSDRECSLTLKAIRVSINLESELFAQEGPAAAKQLHADLLAAATEFVTDFLRVLDLLAELRVVGTIVWPIPNACRFRFFQTQVEGKLREFNSTVSRDDTMVRQQIRQSEVTHTLHAQQQHLASARRTELPVYRGEMPLRVRELTVEIPAWLAPCVDIVDGDLFRSEVGQQPLGTELHEEVVSETDLPYDEDPAMVLGPFVLAAWLPHEAEEEQARAQRRDGMHTELLNRQRRAGQRNALWKLANAGRWQVLPCALQLVACYGWPSLHVPLIVVAWLALLLRFRQLMAFLRDYGTQPNVSNLLVLVAAAGFSLTTFHLAIVTLVYLSWTLLVATTLCAGMSCFFVRELPAMLSTQDHS